VHPGEGDVAQLCPTHADHTGPEPSTRGSEEQVSRAYRQHGGCMQEACLRSSAHGLPGALHSLPVVRLRTPPPPPPPPLVRVQSGLRALRGDGDVAGDRGCTMETRDMRGHVRTCVRPYLQPIGPQRVAHSGAVRQVDVAPQPSEQYQLSVEMRHTMMPQRLRLQALVLRQPTATNSQSARRDDEVLDESGVPAVGSWAREVCRAWGGVPVRRAHRPASQSRRGRGRAIGRLHKVGQRRLALPSRAASSARCRRSLPVMILVPTDRRNSRPLGTETAPHAGTPAGLTQALSVGCGLDPARWWNPHRIRGVSCCQHWPHVPGFQGSSFSAPVGW